jgi:transcription elongation GreA/GreB family factor
MVALSNGAAGEVIRLQKLARLKKFEELQSAWVSVVERNSFTVNDCLAVLEVVSAQNDPKQTEDMVWLYLSSAGEKKSPAEALEIARNVAGLVHESENIRNETTALYRKVYQANPDIEPILEITLLRKGAALHAAVQQADKFLALQEATYVLDKNLSSPGKIVGLDKNEKVMVIIFNGEEKRYGPPIVNRLEPLDADDFRALQTFNTERVEELASDDPAELVRLVLKSYGPTLKFREMKPYIAPFIKGETWTKWWQEAKAKVKRSPIVEMTDTAQPTFTLRARPLSYEFRVRDDFDNAETFEDKLNIVLDYLREKDASATPDEKILKFFEQQFVRFGSSSNDTVTQLAALAGLKKLHNLYPNVIENPAANFNNLFHADGDLTNFFGNSFNDEVCKIVLNFIREECADSWYDLFARILPGASAGVCEWIESELLAQGYRDSFAKSVEMVLHWPDRYPRAIVWMWKALCVGKCPEPFKDLNRTTLLTGIFTAAQALKRKPPFEDPEQQKRALNQLRNALTSGDYGLLRNVLKSASRDYANYLKDTYEFNTGFSDAVKTDIDRVLHHVRPDLYSKSLPPWEEDVVYTTEAALNRKNEELAKLVNVDIAHNAKTIGEAAERGDLSENAEFTAALEERDRLTERATRLQTELKKARIIYQGFAANSDYVNIGTRVRATNVDSNAEETFVFLGPWDADPKQGIFSYLAPLSKSFMGKKSGEVVVHTTDSGASQWKIIDITPAI